MNTDKQKKFKHYLFSDNILTKKIVLPITLINENLNKTIKEMIKYNFEGKCGIEGYVQPNSSEIITYSSGIIEHGNLISFHVVFKCKICFPVEGMILECIAKNITKAGIRAESSEVSKDSPFVVFIAKDHNYNNETNKAVINFNKIDETYITQNKKFNVKVIGQRFELNDKYISIIGEINEIL